MSFDGLKVDNEEQDALCKHFVAKNICLRKRKEL
jgi:hypothetical protein